MLRLQRDLYIGLDQSLATRAAQISLGFRGQGEGEFQDISDASLAGLPRGESAAQLLSPSGEILESSGDTVANHPIISKQSIAKVLKGEKALQTVMLEKDTENFRVLAVKIPDKSDPRVIVVTASTEDADNSIHRLLILLLISGPAALVAASIGGWFIARKALLPVSRITSKAAEIGVNQLDERIEVPPMADELSRLATTLNDMLDRLQGGVEEKRRFIADASHELRTPLAIMRSEIDVSLSSDELTQEATGVLESLREEVGRMTQIVENLLTLARIDEGKLRLLRQPVDIRKLTEAVAQNMRYLAAAKNIQINVGGDSLHAEADPEYLEQVVVNLIDNAIKYSYRDGLITVRTWQADTEVGLTVSDSGRGISADLLPHVFDRFFRVDMARSRDAGGSGLGLSICRQIVEAHNGRIWVESEPGRGSSFSVSLPISLVNS